MAQPQSQRVAEHFGEEWRDYERQIRRTIPFYDESLTLLVDVLGELCDRPQRLLDLGIGTGNLASQLLATFPDAHLTGIDLVADYLEVAKRRLQEHAHRLTLVEADVAEYEFEGAYDVIVTSFVLHHSPDATKRRVYERAFEALTPGGCVMNADFVDSGSALYSRVFDDLRVQRMRESGATEEQIQVEYVEHRELELPTPMEEQLSWLRDIGFVDVECFWKYLNLSIFGGRTSPPPSGPSRA